MALVALEVVMTRGQLLQNIVEAPRQWRTNALLMADWLEEQGDAEQTAALRALAQGGVYWMDFEECRRWWLSVKDMKSQLHPVVIDKPVVGNEEPLAVLFSSSHYAEYLNIYRLLPTVSFFVHPMSLMEWTPINHGLLTLRFVQRKSRELLSPTPFPDFPLEE